MTPDLDDAPGAQAYVGISYNAFAMRYGPYPPSKVGEFLLRLMAAHTGSHPFFFTITLDPIDDPVPELLRLAAEADEADLERLPDIVGEEALG